MGESSGRGRPGRGATMHDGVHMAELTLDRDNIAEIPPHCSLAIVFGVVLANTFDPTQQQLPSDFSSWAIRCDTGNSIVRRCGKQATSKRALNRPTRCGDWARQSRRRGGARARAASARRRRASRASHG